MRGRCGRADLGGGAGPFCCLVPALAGGPGPTPRNPKMVQRVQGRTARRAYDGPRREAADFASPVPRPGLRPTHRWARPVAGSVENRSRSSQRGGSFLVPPPQKMCLTGEAPARERSSPPSGTTAAPRRAAPPTPPRSLGAPGPTARMPGSGPRAQRRPDPPPRGCGACSASRPASFGPRCSLPRGCRAPIVGGRGGGYIDQMTHIRGVLSTAAGTPLGRVSCGSSALILFVGRAGPDPGAGAAFSRPPRPSVPAFLMHRIGRRAERRVT